MEKSKELQEWYDSRPPAIKELIDKYPPGEYKMGPLAPYGISCPGTPVNIISYREDGKVKVVVRAADKLPAAIRHEDMLCDQHHRTPEQREAIHNTDVLVDIDPRYLEYIGPYNDILF